MIGEVNLASSFGANYPSGTIRRPSELRRPPLAYLAMSLSVAVEWFFLFWLAIHLVSVGGLPAIAAATATAVMWCIVLGFRAIGSRLLASLGAVARTALLSSSTTILFPLVLGTLADSEGLHLAFWLIPVASLLALGAVRLAGPLGPVRILLAPSGHTPHPEGEFA